MKKVKLKTTFEGHSIGDIIEVTNNVAFGLIDTGKATLFIKKDNFLDDADNKMMMSEKNFGTK